MLDSFTKDPASLGISAEGRFWGKMSDVGQVLPIFK